MKHKKVILGIMLSAFFAFSMGYFVTGYRPPGPTPVVIGVYANADSLTVNEGTWLNLGPLATTISDTYRHDGDTLNIVSGEPTDPGMISVKFDFNGETAENGKIIVSSYDEGTDGELCITIHYKKPNDNDMYMTIGLTTIEGSIGVFSIDSTYKIYAVAIEIDNEYSLALDMVNFVDYTRTIYV